MITEFFLVAWFGCPLSETFRTICWRCTVYSCFKSSCLEPDDGSTRLYELPHYRDETFWPLPFATSFKLTVLISTCSSSYVNLILAQKGSILFLVLWQTEQVCAWTSLFQDFISSEIIKIVQYGQSTIIKVDAT